MLYFDHNATTPLAPQVAEALAAASRDVFGNASSTHRAGQLARQHLENSRRTVAGSIHASPSEIVFTSGGTESNNLAILGLLRNWPATARHVVTTAIEHPSVLEAFHYLERQGVAVTYLRAGSCGLVDLDELARCLRDDTVLVSVMHANNEIGTIQPISRIAALLRARRAAGQQIYLHSDGVQALGKMAIDLPALGADLYSISAHKVHGPKGVGALFVRKGVPLRGIQYGGRHERERRPGTENVPAAIAFARALELSPHTAAPIAEMRDRFEARVLAALPDVEINGSTSARLPNTSNLLFRGISGEALVIALDMKGIAVSTGSACSSGSIEPSHVLLAIGRSRQEAKSSLRFSFGRYNTLEDAGALADAVVTSARQLRNRIRPEAHLVPA
ncbi:MAG TPA: cysteine desulfurase family protein [Bryobacteraceae bacterium]|nr:cysteine desulfurase family protein [Bryobacteraceae bacterium]